VCSRATARARSQKRHAQRERRPQQRKPLLQREDAGSGGLRPQNQLAAGAVHRASAIRSLPWQPARRSRKSPLPARVLARTISAPPLPGTNGLAASKSVMGGSTPPSQYRPSNAPRSEARIRKSVADSKGARSTRSTRRAGTRSRFVAGTKPSAEISNRCEAPHIGATQRAISCRNAAGAARSAEF
jgi:hypothetical protein